MTRAIVLAAGLGSRLQPLTFDRPKALVPLFGIALIDYALLALRRAGIGDIAVNLHHLAKPLMSHVAQRAAQWGLHVVFSQEPEILGTGGALWPLRPFVGRQPFVMVNADVFHTIDIAALLSDHRTAGAAATVAVTRDAQRPELALVHYQPDGRVVAIGPERCSEVGLQHAIFSGVHVLSSDIFDVMPQRGTFCIVREGYRRLLSQGFAVRAMDAAQDLWFDLGTPAQYLRAHAQLFAHLASRVAPLMPDWPFEQRMPGVFVHRDLKRFPEMNCHPPVLLDRDIDLARGARIGPSVVVGSGATIAKDVTVEHALLWPGAVVEQAVCNAIVLSDGTIVAQPPMVATQERCGGAANSTLTDSPSIS